MISQLNSEFNFQSQTTRYSSQNAYWLAKVAKLVYTKVAEDNPAPDRDKIWQQLQSWSDRFQDIAVFNNKSTQSFVAQHEDFIIAAFRGTDQLQDWLDNLNLPVVPTLMGGAHRGFLMALADVWPDMLNSIQSFQVERINIREGFNSVSKYKTLWITGHSLGGALATLAAADLIDKDQPFSSVYTFGQPRCVNRQMARNMNIEAKNRIFRFQNNNDIVTRIPQRVMGYSHVGTFLYIDVHKKLHTDIHWWNQFLDRTEGLLEALPKPGIDKIQDHDMDDYIQGVHNNININPLNPN
jgi:hypothetical protein